MIESRNSEGGRFLNTGTLTGTAGWLRGTGQPIYSVLHSALPELTRDAAVLLVPPFGWDELVSHRTRRYWAVRLARMGYSCLRIDLPGTGDSLGGPRDPELAASWTTAIAESAQWLRQVTGARRIVAIGIRIGGLLAARAVVEGAPIDDLILWATPGRGRSAVRELIAHSGMIDAYPDDHGSEHAEPEGGTDVAGFLLSDETRAGLSALNIAEMTFPTRELRRALLLGRDQSDVDAGLLSSLKDSGFDVEVARTDEYAALMSHPQSVSLKRPEATIRLSLEWLARGEAAPSRGLGIEAVDVTSDDADPASLEASSGVLKSVEFEHDGRQIRETVIPLSAGGARTFGILTEAVHGGRAGVGAVILNAGTMRKVGLHRMSVEQARRWAARGVPSVRFDLEAIGDAEGPGDRGEDERPLVTTTNLTSSRAVASVAGIMNQLRTMPLAERLVVVGHCSGAYLSFHAALAASEVIGCFGVNQMAFLDNEELYQDRVLAMVRSALRKGLLRRLREQGISAHELRQVRDAVRHRIRRLAAESAEDRDARSGVRMLDNLRDRNVAFELFFSRPNLFYAELKNSPLCTEPGRWPNTRVHELPSDDPNTRAIWLQELIHQQLDAALDRLLAQLGVSESGAPETPVPAAESLRVFTGP